MAAKSKKGQFNAMATPLSQERLPMPSLKTKKQKKTSRGK
jgi:hypothetical protein